MPLLIDGYNLVHVAGILGRGVGPGGLQRSRLALLNFLVESLEPAELPHTTVVFDAHDAPRGLPCNLEHRGIVVRFAAQYDSADTLIEELIAASSAPRRLVVVSSDRHIQRAARRRRAKAVGSDVWYADLLRARQQRLKTSSQSPARPPAPLLEEDVNYWLRQFGGESAFTELLTREAGHQQDAFEESARHQPTPDEPAPDRFNEIDNPFPPGYGEDLLGDF